MKSHTFTLTTEQVVDMLLALGYLRDDKLSTYGRRMYEAHQNETTPKVTVILAAIERVDSLINCLELILQ